MAKPIPTPLALLQVDNHWIRAPILASTSGAVLREDLEIRSVSLLMEACLQSRLACTSADYGPFRGGWLIDLWITSRYYDGSSILGSEVQVSSLPKAKNQPACIPPLLMP